MRRSAWRSRRCSSSIRSTPTFPCPKRRWRRSPPARTSRMTVDAIPGRTFEGKIKAIDARVSAKSRNVTARAEFANADRKLLPGMFANLTVTTGAQRRRADVASHRDRLQPLRRQRVRGEARAACRRTRRNPAPEPLRTGRLRRRRNASAGRSHRRAAVRAKSAPRAANGSPSRRGSRRGSRS